MSGTPSLPLGVRFLMGGAMLGNYLLTWYLFLGGAGAGLFLVAYAAVLLNCRDPQPLSRVVLGKVWPRALGASIAFLIVGCICLLRDLTRSGQAFYLFVKPSFSAISVGAYSLGILVLCLILLIALHFRRHDAIHLRFVFLAGAVAAVFALIVILYTGFLLQSIAAVPFWRSSLIVPVFTASSFSSGIGLFALVCCTVFRERTLFLKEHGVILNVDTVVLLVEILLIAAFAFGVASTRGPGVLEGFVPGGTCFWAFWIGVVALGLFTPLILYRMPCYRLEERYRLFVTASCCSVAGAFFLRYCFIFGAVHISSIILLGV